MFCKLFGTDNDQVLVKLDSNDDGFPEVRIYFEPPDLGVCAAAFSWNDSDTGWDTAEKTFADITEAKAREIVAAQLKVIEQTIE